MSVKTGRILFGLLLIIVGAWWIWSSRPPSVSIESRQIQVGALTRQYRLVKPIAASQSKLPVVIALHGALDTTEEMAKYTQLDDLGARQGFALAYLQGQHLNWSPFIPEETPDIYEPDLAFFDAVVDQLISEGMDAERIYLVGVSQGGCMANLVAMKRSARLAAAVVNCGWVPKPLDVTPPETEHKCPMMFIVGSEDKQVDAESVREGYELFKMANHPVRFEVLHGAGHGWNAGYGVNELIWEFLRDKENRQAPKAGADK